DRADQPTPLPGGQRRVQRILDKAVAEQPHLPAPHAARRVLILFLAHGGPFRSGPHGAGRSRSPHRLTDHPPRASSCCPPPTTRTQDQDLSGREAGHRTGPRPAATAHTNRPVAAPPPRPTPRAAPPPPRPDPRSAPAPRTRRRTEPR